MRCYLVIISGCSGTIDRSLFVFNCNCPHLVLYCVLGVCCLVVCRIVERVMSLRVVSCLIRFLCLRQANIFFNWMTVDPSKAKCENVIGCYDKQAAER